MRSITIKPYPRMRNKGEVFNWNLTRPGTWGSRPLPLQEHRKAIHRNVCTG